MRRDTDPERRDGFRRQGDGTVLVERRELLKMLGAAAGTATLGGCDRTWSVPERLVELALRGPGLESERRTICGLCEGGCGLAIRLVDGMPVGVKGNAQHPLNKGGVCPVGLSALEVLYSPDRLRGPLRRGSDGSLNQVDWESVLEEISGALSGLAEEGRGEQIALLSGHTDLLFNDLAAQFAAALGSGSMARLHAEPTAPFRLTQGLDEVPGYDLARADLVLSFGLELYEDGPTPLHAIQSTVGSRPDGERCALIYVGSRMSPSAAKADLRVVVRPGTLGAFALGVAHVLVREGRFDRQFVTSHTFGFDDWVDEDGQARMGFRRLLLEKYYPDRTAQLCGCEPGQVIRVARRFAAAEAPVALSGGVATRGSNETFTVAAIHALNALMGSFDKPGGVTLPPVVPFTPMPTVESVARPSGVRASDAPPVGLGADPVEELIGAVQSGSGPKVLIIVGSNPVYDTPAGHALAQAIAGIETVVHLTPFIDDTALVADYVLPTSTFLETWQSATTPAGVDFSVLGIGKPVVEPLHDTRHAGDVLLELSSKFGEARSAALPWSDYESYLRYRLGGLATSGQGAVATGSFEDSWVRFLEERGWRFLAHEGIEGFWTSLERESAWWNPVHTRGDWSRMFRTPSGRFEFYSQILEKHLLELGESGGETDESSSRGDRLKRGVESLQLAAPPDEVCLPHFEPPDSLQESQFHLQPFRPITARGSLGAISPMVLEMFGYTQISGWQTHAEMAPEVAHDLGLHAGDVVRLESSEGGIEAVVRVLPGCDAGSVHVPLGLGHPPILGMENRVGENPVTLMTSVRDPVSGRVSLNSTGVTVRLLRRGRGGGPVSAHGGALS